jgi:hypothetical protein
MAMQTIEQNVVGLNFHSLGVIVVFKRSLKEGFRLFAQALAVIKAFVNFEVLEILVAQIISEFVKALVTQAI